VSCCDISVANTSRIYEIAGKSRRNKTSTKLTLETENTKRGDYVSFSEPIFNCHIFLTSEMFRKRKKSTSPNALFSCRNKKRFISKSRACEYVYTGSIYRSKFAKERVKRTNFVVNIESKFEMPRDNLFAAAINSGYTETEENTNMRVVSETAVILNIIINQTIAISGANRCALNIGVRKFIRNIYLACGSASCKASVEPPAMAGFVTVLPNKISGRGLCNSMEHYFKGHCLSLHRLQQEGKLIIVSNKFGITGNNLL
jgi:hypothetical protein